MQLRWRRARSRRTIALAIIAIVSFPGGIGTLLYAGFRADTTARSPLSPGPAESIPGWEIPVQVPEASLIEGTGGRSAGRPFSLNDLLASPRLSFAYSPPESSLWVRSFRYSVADVTAFINACAGGSEAIPLRCGDFMAAEAGLDPQAPVAWTAAIPPKANLAAADPCAGAGCRSPGSAAQDGDAALYASLAGRFDISASNQISSLPAPQSGWLDVGYTSQGNPQWRQTLGALCESSRPVPTSAIGVQCSLPSASNIGVWRMSFQAAGLEGAFSAKDWHFNLGQDDGINVLLASALNTPLQGFDVAPSWGIQVNVPGGFHLIGTALGVDLVQADVSFGQVFAGVAPVGTFGGLQFDGDAVNGSISAISSAGLTQVIGDVTVQVGDLNLSSALSTSDFSLGVSRKLRNGATMQLSWSNSDGLGTAYMIPGGPTARLSWSNDNGFKFTVVSLISLGIQPFAVAPQGGMALGFTPPSAFNSAPPAVDFRLPFAAAAQPPIPGTSAMRSASATVVIRFCVDGTTDATCRQAEVRAPLQLSVDGQLVAATGERILVSPGFHVIAVPVELLPAHLVALGALTCNLTVAASTVSYCDLPVHKTAP